jgi:peptidoglycan hydrolase CwlO-like protein
MKLDNIFEIIVILLLILIVLCIVIRVRKLSNINEISEHFSDIIEHLSPEDAPISSNTPKNSLQEGTAINSTLIDHSNKIQELQTDVNSMKNNIHLNTEYIDTIKEEVALLEKDLK